MKQAFAIAASVAAGALAVGVGPAAADLPVAGNSATDSIGTVQVGPTVAGATAVVTSQAATAAVGAVVATVGDGGNTASNSIGTVQAGGGNDVERSVGTAQVNSVRVAPHTHVHVRPAGVDLRLGGHVGIAGGRNSAKHSVGTVQVGGIDVAPEVSLNVGPLARIWLGGGSSIGGPGGNSADDSIGTAQVGGGNDAHGSIGTVQVGSTSVQPSVVVTTPGGGNGGGGPSGGGTSGGGTSGGGSSGGGGPSGGGERSLATSSEIADAAAETQKATTAKSAKKTSTTFRPPATPSASRRIEGTVAQPVSSSVQGSSLPFTGLAPASFLAGALALTLVGLLLRRAARPAR